MRGVAFSLGMVVAICGAALVINGLARGAVFS